MAIYHLHAQSGGRRSTSPKSAETKIRYICKVGRYARKDEHVVHVESGHMPPWACQQEARSWKVKASLVYWQSADQHERKNGRLFKEVEVALPDEMTAEERLELIRAFARDITTVPTEGCLPYAFAIHARAGPTDSLSHFHAHIVCSERVNDGIERTAEIWFRRAAVGLRGAPVDPRTGGARKTVRLRNETWLMSIRRRWATFTNDALRRAGCAARIDHRSLQAQGIDREPEIKIGVGALAAARRGAPSLRFEIANAQRAVRKITAELEEAKGEVRELEELEREEATQKEALRARRVFDERSHNLDAAVAWRKAAIRFAVRRGERSDLIGERDRETQIEGQRGLLEHPWRESRREDQSLVYESESGRFVDSGSEITAGEGNDAEISAMLTLARQKGWRSLQFSGDEHFRRRAMMASLDAGFGLELATEEEQRLFAEVRKERERGAVATSPRPTPLS